MEQNFVWFLLFCSRVFNFFSHFSFSKKNVPWVFWVNMATINKKQTKNKKWVNAWVSISYPRKPIWPTHTWDDQSLKCPFCPESHHLCFFGDFAPIPVISAFSTSPTPVAPSPWVFTIPKSADFSSVALNAILSLGFSFLEAQLHCLFSHGLYSPLLPASWLLSQNSNLPTLNVKVMFLAAVEIIVNSNNETNCNFRLLWG